MPAPVSASSCGTKNSTCGHGKQKQNTQLWVRAALPVRVGLFSLGATPFEHVRQPEAAMQVRSQ